MLIRVHVSYLSYTLHSLLSQSLVQKGILLLKRYSHVQYIQSQLNMLIISMRGL